MSNFQTKKSLIAIKEETTEGTPIFPTSAEDFIPIRTGFTAEPNIPKIDNEELTGSLGAAKGVLGIEDPTAGLSIYTKASGVEGTAPDASLLYEAAFGAKVVASTEFDTVSSTAGTASAAATLTVDTGEGVNFEAGQAVLIKDSANVFSLRNVESVSGDVLTLNFNLDDNPGASVNLGKAILYKPGEDHPTFTTHIYWGNGAVLDVIAGCRVTELVSEVTADELLGGAVSLSGVGFFKNPIEVTATSNKIDFVDDGGTKAAEITAQTYKTPKEIASAIETAMNGASVDVITVTHSNSTGKFTIAADSGVTFSLLWKTGASGSDNTDEHVGTLIGFSDAADDTGAFTYTSDLAQDLTAQFTPSFDTQDPFAGKNGEVFVGTFDDNVCLKANSIVFTLTDTKENIDEICAVSGRSASLISEYISTVAVTAFIDEHDIDIFDRLINNTDTRFLFNFGTRSAGNWVAGAVGNVYIKTGTVEVTTREELNSVVAISFTVKSFVSSGAADVFLNFA